MFETLEPSARPVRHRQPFPPYYIDDLKLLAHLLQSCGYTASTIRSSDGALEVILDRQVEDAA